MTSRAGSDRYAPVSLVAWSVFIEALRRKDFYVLLIMGALFAAGVIIARVSGTMTEATGVFLLNLGMSISFLFAAILAAVMSVRMMPGELEQRTIHPLLAKPVSRAQVIFGKWIATSASSSAAMLVLFLIVYLPVPKNGSLSFFLLLQAIILKIVALGLLGAIGMLFSLIMPRALNLVLLAFIYTLSGTVSTFLRAKAMRSSLQDVWLWLIRYIPNFDLMDLTKRFTDGAPPLAGPQFIGILAYGIVATIFALAISCRIFERKAL
ncbi:ABC transporter permease subunit [Candidatus Sumerlaeota bacterium]|nr:ABC transporter permease subunit [Candidatus Sumerlaeota bacterium]